MRSELGHEFKLSLCQKNQDSDWLTLLVYYKCLLIRSLGFWRGKAWTHVLYSDLRKHCLKFQDCLEIDLKTLEKRPRPPGKFGQNWFSLTKLLSRLWWHSSEKRAFMFDYISQWIFLKIWKLVVFFSSFFSFRMIFYYQQNDNFTISISWGFFKASSTSNHAGTPWCL